MPVKSLDECVRENLDVYFRDLGDQTPHSLHEMVVKLDDFMRRRSKIDLVVHDDAIRNLSLIHI